MFLGLAFSIILCCSLCTASSTSPTADDIQAFNLWLDEQSASVPCRADCPLLKVKVGKTPGMGIGVLEKGNATARINPRSIILSLPVEATFCAESIQQRHKDLLTLLSLRRGDEEVIAVAVLAERVLAGYGLETPFAQWLRVVPQPGTLTAAYLWPPTLIASIEPFQVRDLVQRVRNGMLDDYRHGFATKRHWDILQKYMSKLISVTPPAQQQSAATTTTSQKFVAKEWFTESLYMWARNLVDSRAWNMHGKKYLVPGADFFNHKEDLEDLKFDFRDQYYAPQRYRSSKFLETHRIGSATSSSAMRVLEVRSDRKGSGTADEQLFESYGDSTTDIYLTYHGFVPPQNRWDCESFDEMPLPNKKQLGVSSRCVHDGELPPPFLFASLQAYLEKHKTSVDGDVPQCVERYAPSSAAKTYQSEQKRWRQTAHSCLCVPGPDVGDAKSIAAHVVQLLHQYLVAEAKKRFTTLNTTQDDSIIAAAEQSVDPSSAVLLGEHPESPVTAAMFRRQRRKLVKKFLQNVRKEQKALEDLCDAQSEL